MSKGTKRKPMNHGELVELALRFSKLRQQLRAIQEILREHYPINHRVNRGIDSLFRKMDKCRNDLDIIYGESASNKNIKEYGWVFYKPPEMIESLLKTHRNQAHGENTSIDQRIEEKIARIAAMSQWERRFEKCPTPAKSNEDT